jgi:hypothetical protein
MLQFRNLTFFTHFCGLPMRERIVCTSTHRCTYAPLLSGLSNKDSRVTASFMIQPPARLCLCLTLFCKNPSVPFSRWTEVFSRTLPLLLAQCHRLLLAQRRSRLLLTQLLNRSRRHRHSLSRRLRSASSRRQRQWASNRRRWQWASSS